MRLEKYAEAYGLRRYKTKDERYELIQDYQWQGRRRYKVYKLYVEGNYIGMPESVKAANEWIKYHEGRGAQA